jgi:RNA polymerase sigma-70 factor (ECF subfamily)
VESLSDEVLMGHLALGSSAALPVLIARHRTRLFALLLRATGRRSDAEDLFQETWLRVGRQAQRYDPSRPFGPWLATLASRLAIDFARAGARHQPAPRQADEQLPETASSRPTPEALVAQAQARSEVAEALQSLPPHLREAVLLRYFNELDEQAMAEALRVPKGTVKSRLHHGLKALRAALAQDSDDE